MASYLLQESGSKLVLENGSGDLLLEISVPAVVTSAGDDTWYTYASALLAKRKRPRVPRPKPKVAHIDLILDESDWTDEDLAFLMALDILG